MANLHTTSIRAGSAARQSIAATIALVTITTTMLLAQRTSAPKPPAKPAAPPAAAPAAKPAAATVPPPGARAFATAQAAADAMIQAASTFDEPALVAMFGQDSKDLITTGDAVRDKSYTSAFASLAKEGHTVVISPSTPGKAVLQVGQDRWPLPVPLVKIAGKWYFDAKAGRD